MQQDRGIRRRNNGHMFQDSPQGWAFAHDIFKAALKFDFWFEIELIGFNPANLRKACCCKAPDISEINSRARHNLLPKARQQLSRSPCLWAKLDDSSELRLR